VKISEQNINGTGLSTDNKFEEQKKSDRFSQLLRKDEQKNRHEATDKKEPVPVNADSMPLALSNTTFADGQAPDTPAIARETASRTHSAADAQIERLAVELGHQIDVLKLCGKTTGINITFSAKTLEGLHVQIRQVDGELAIRFVTQSESVSNLLAQHTGQLREALSGKGVKIRNISITNKSRGTPGERTGSHAGT
jgi:flagellar hook-length control protein FliK